MDLSLAPIEGDLIINEHKSKYNLILVDPPYRKNERNVNSPNFQARHINFSENNVINKSIGLAGELLVLEREKQYLRENGRGDLADKFWHTSISS